MKKILLLVLINISIFISVSGQDSIQILPKNWSEICAKTYYQYDSLMMDMQKNPKNYPLHELEDPNKKEPTLLRQWEHVVDNSEQQMLHLMDDGSFTATIDSNQVVTFCSSPTQNINIKLANNSSFDFPVGYLRFLLPKGINVADNQTDTTLRKVGSRDFETPILKAKSSISFNLNFTINCDGKGGSITQADNIYKAPILLELQNGIWLYNPTDNKILKTFYKFKTKNKITLKTKN